MVTAYLRTRCGCQRQIEIAFPCQPIIIMPIMDLIREASFSAKKLDALSTSACKVRRFILEEPAHTPNGVAVYYEENQP